MGSSFSAGISAAAATLVGDYSLEMTGKDLQSLDAAAPTISPGTKINVTFLGNEDLAMRVTAARKVRELGFTPVPHISARRIASQTELEEFLTALQSAGAAEHVFSVGGDPGVPMGPYADSLSVIRTGLLQKFGVREVSIAGYPEGHPEIETDVLWRHLEDKAKLLDAEGLDSVILTQFSFDPAVVINWIKEVRSRGINTPIRVGTPGPAGIKRLLGFARRFGIGANAMIVKKYGFSLTNLVGTAGPERFVTELATLLSQEPTAGDVKLHFYTFGALKASSEWVSKYRAGQAK